MPATNQPIKEIHEMIFKVSLTHMIPIPINTDIVRLGKISFNCVIKP